MGTQVLLSPWGILCVNFECLFIGCQSLLWKNGVMVQGTQLTPQICTPLFSMKIYEQWSRQTSVVKNNTEPLLLRSSLFFFALD